MKAGMLKLVLAVICALLMNLQGADAWWNHWVRKTRTACVDGLVVVGGRCKTPPAPATPPAPKTLPPPAAETTKAAPCGVLDAPTCKTGAPCLEVPGRRLDPVDGSCRACGEDGEITCMTGTLCEDGLIAPNNICGPVPPPPLPKCGVLAGPPCKEGPPCEEGLHATAAADDAGTCEFPDQSIPAADSTELSAQVARDMPQPSGCGGKGKPPCDEGPVCMANLQPVCM